MLVCCDLYFYCKTHFSLRIYLTDQTVEMLHPLFFHIQTSNFWAVKNFMAEDNIICSFMFCSTLFEQQLKLYHVILGFLSELVVVVVATI